MTDQNETERYPPSTISPPYPSLDGDADGEGEGEGESDETLDSFAELVYRYHDTYSKLCEVVENETSRTILELLVDYDGSGVSYDMVLDYVDVSRWTVKMRTYDLRDAGIVEVTDTGISLVSLTEDVYVYLIQDALHKHYSEITR